jgi:uncharacterized membrane protein YfcA
MPVDLALFDLVVIFMALFMGGLVKGVLGMGMPVIAVPIIAGFLGVEHAVIVMTIPGILLNGWLCWQERSHASDVPEMKQLLITGAIGAVIGSWVLFVASDKLLSIALVIWIGVFFILRFSHPEMTINMNMRMRISPIIGVVAGVFQGAMGTCSAILGTYLNAADLKPGSFIFAISAPFFILALAQYVTYVALGMYTSQLYIESALAMIPSIISIGLGAWFRKWVNKKMFDILILLLMAFIGIKLVVNVM